jgi:hypothetical protein
MKDQAETILKGRLDGKQRNRLIRLLDMEYKPGELAEELGFNTEQVYRVYLPLGCPHERDQKRYININGKEFKRWYLEKYQKTVLKEDESFCKSCQKAVKIDRPVFKKKGGLDYVLSVCPFCGRHLSKIIGYQKGKHDQQE